MAKKPDGLVADRPVLSIRPQTDLKRRLEQAAESNGRSIAREAEHRLEESFEAATASRLERFIKNRPGLSYMIGMVTPLEFTNQLGDVLLTVVRHAEDCGWSEVQAREALSAAYAVVGHYYFWRGEDAAPVPAISPIPAADTRLKDLPPALAGYIIAEEHLLFSSTIQEHATYESTVGGRIANVWSGDGKAVEVIAFKEAERKPTKRQRERLKDAGGLLGEEETARLHAERKLKAVPPAWFQVLTAREAEIQGDD